MKILNRKTYHDAMGDILPHEGFAEEIIRHLQEPESQRRPARRLAAAAAIAMLVSAGGAIGAAALEAKEYRDAAAFFEAYELPTDALTRSEIKAVYRDITTGSFSLSKTSEILLRETKGEIAGQAITPGEVEQIWNARNAVIAAAEKGEYHFETVEQMDETHGFPIETHTIARRYDGEKALWEIRLDNFWVEGHISVEGGILVYGNTFAWGSAEKRYARLALIGEDGTLRWDKRLDRGYNRDMLYTAIADGERLVVFGRGDFVELTVTVYDYAGSQLLFTAHEVGNYGIRQAVRLGDGYLVQLSNSWNGDRLIKLDQDGALLDVLTYTADDVSYVITDMLELNGRLYLSAYAFPLSADGDMNGRREIGAILDEIFAREQWDMGSAELVNLLRAQYTAVLFLCNPENGEPEQFYSVTGALGGALTAGNQGQLCWDTEHFTDAYVSLATSSFTIGASCSILRYTFAADGTLLGETATGEASGYRR